MTQVLALMPEGPGPCSATRTEPAVNEVRRVPLAALKVDQTVQQRVGGTAKKVVAQYAEAMRGGAAFPPPVVFSEGGDDHHLADGFHRVAAHRLAHPDKEEIECDVHPGTREALSFLPAAQTLLTDRPAPRRISGSLSFRF
jgi:hypothetical protein